MRSQKKWKAVVLSAALILTTLFSSACGKGESAEKTTSAKKAEKTASGSETAKETAAGAGVVSVSISKSNGWSDGTASFAQYDIAIANGESVDISDWALSVTVPSGTALSQGPWNAKGSVSGTTLTLTPESYNGTVTAGASVTGIGLIAKVPTDAVWDTYSITYEKADGTTASAGGKSGEAAVVPSENAEETETGNLVGEGMKKTRTLPVSTPSATAAAIPALSVRGSQLVTAAGPVRLQGVSTHGLAWFPQYVNSDAFRTLRDDWGANCIRLAMYTAESGGYCAGGDQAQLKALIDKGVKAASDLGMYVIIDWHILSDGNPKTHQAEAIAFFREISKKYASYTNIIYEICNEPNGNVTWSRDIKPYAEAVIPVIRANDPDSVIIVGTPTWSQEIDKAAADPLKYGNIMYAFHFYAGTHKDDLRKRVTTAVKGGLPVFITECSITDASGNGACDKASAEAWRKVISDCGLSFMEWSLSNKAESSAILKSSCQKTGTFTASDLNESGAWYRGVMRSFAGK